MAFTFDPQIEAALAPMIAAMGNAAPLPAGDVQERRPVTEAIMAQTGGARPGVPHEFETFATARTSPGRPLPGLRGLPASDRQDHPGHRPHRNRAQARHHRQPRHPAKEQHHERQPGYTAVPADPA